MLRNTPEQIQQRQAYAVKDAVATREQLDRAAYTVREIVERIPTRHEQRQWLVWTAVALVTGLILEPPLAYHLIRHMPDSWMRADSVSIGLMDAAGAWAASHKRLQRANPQNWNGLAANFAPEQVLG